MARITRMAHKGPLMRHPRNPRHPRLEKLEEKMFKKFMVIIALAAPLALPAAAQDAKIVIANASKAMGYDQLRTIEYSGSGFEGTALGQAQSATGGWPKFTLKSFSRYVDLNAGSGQQTALRSRPLDPSTGQ